jgi:hypothetical protein
LLLSWRFSIQNSLPLLSRTLTQLSSTTTCSSGRKRVATNSFFAFSELAS